MTGCVLVLGLLMGCGEPGVSVPTPPADRWVAEDKVQHLSVSFAATGMAYGVGRVGLGRQDARIAAVAVAGLLGVGKELMDVRRGGPFSMKDLVWDAVGVALGYTFVQQIR